MNQAISITMLDGVINRTIETVETSKSQIFEIAENARQEGNSLKHDLHELRQEIAKVISKVDELELSYRRARARLVLVSRNFQTYTEEDIRIAYEEANRIQVELSIYREREDNLKKRRNDLERQLRTLEETIERAEKLVTQMGVVLGYLTGDLSKVGEALEEAKQHQLMGLKVIQAQEEERKRVAREIHDGPAQSMANVVLRSEIVEKMLKNERILEAQMELHELKEMVRLSLADVRRIIFDLRPMALDDLGLVPTLQKYIQTYEDRTKISVDLVVFGVEQPLKSSVKAAMFRLVQECLNNVEKHSGASMVQVKIEFQENTLRLVVKDDGIGFDQAAQKAKGGSYGLLGMRERAQLLEGTMELQSSPGEGTKVMFQIPVKF
ncbi:MULTISPECIES: sensor histidine kinase [Brevibacillus]|jgi:two-component system sensor histidine kinase DegS|uniref:Signal transduction histidine-protein kinase/phosphatase DegS n=2 Tax=Bacillati TaxID=1783272 RepID=M8DFK7_9BACL|nr:sensor histidine kinase [Brevibacillus borstelensis]EMT52268.1 two-component sensor histidine kinase [Brevibacillus borstelensis AK1]KKX54714.1 histidine kinase [Brevibacillus borstelensis cifa_chp40]MBE5398313.1 sensor histidine kinase [Brevibacillus borstelensis]MCC0567534.1 sensor histidine kinase [Brevibacillus borstelensis]MCM3471011.1 sensor histidine kinase [Brevibacillus borstelensis]